MNVHRILAGVGVLAVAACAARAADPSVVWTMGAGMPSGQMLLMGQPRGGSIQSGTLVFNFDSGKVETPTAADVAVGSGWRLTNFVRLSANSVRLDMFNNAGQAVAAPVLGITFRHKSAGFGAATITLSGSSNINGEDSDSFPGPFAVDEQPAAFVYGAGRKIGQAAPGAVAVGLNGSAPMAALAADDRLFLVNPMDTQLADMPGWTSGKALNDSISKRPAFGKVNGELIVAAGTDSGRGLVFRVSDGSPLSDVTIGYMAAGTPAVAGAQGDVYWPALTSDGPAIVHQRSGEVKDSVYLGDAVDAFVSSPAVWNGVLVAASQTAARTFRVDPGSGALTPQSDGSLARDVFNTSAVVVGGMGYLGAESGKVYQMNLGTGALGGVATLPTGAAPLSNPFYDSVHGAVVFGGADGDLYRVSTKDLAVSQMNLGGAAINSPAATGDIITVSDAAGSVWRGPWAPGNVAVPLSTPLAPALGIVPGENGRLILNTTGGFLVAMPLS